MGDQASADLISLPAGGGAVRGLGETFQSDPHMGTGRYTVPLELPPGRGNLEPALALAYDTGGGNSPFGLGWDLALPSVRRRTDKRLPRYDDGDTFVLSGAEELVPVPGGAANVQRYRPRVETAFARIEHHTRGNAPWAVWDKNGFVSTYGTPRPARAKADWRDPAAIYDPEDPHRVLAWLVSRTVDAFGNSIVYTYAPDPSDPAGAQRYLTEIRYADHGNRAKPSYLNHVRLVYEPRPDVHVDRRGGFPVTTALRCTAIETWTGRGKPRKTRTVALGYSDATTRADNGVSLLTGITVTGHDGDATQSLPPLTFGYSEWDPTRRRLQAVSGALPGRSLSDPSLDLVDLFGHGLPDVLELTVSDARYWRNRGEGRYDLPRSLPAAPGIALGDRGVRVLDADGDGRPDVVVNAEPLSGYFPLGVDAAFDARGFIPSPGSSGVDFADPEVGFIDLDGDGIVDALRLGAERAEVYLNQRGTAWLAQPSNGASPLRGLSFSDPRVKLADMTGDGLTDVVLVGNGCVQYWPNLGYGRFGSRVAMLGSPRFEDSGDYGVTGFDPNRVLVGDVDGDGCADVVYVGVRSTTVWVNRAGQGFASPVVVPATPPVDDLSAIRLADLLGTGTAGVLWTYDARPHGDSSYKFLDLTGGTKPYLLTDVDNHMGGRTTISYRTSTSYAVEDADLGQPWRTTLPFPVQVVAAVTRTDVFSGTTAISSYRYHHGYWDGIDREFRGFARVEQYDATSVAAPGVPPEQHCPPTMTRTWFHAGPVGRADDWAEVDLSDEYWPGDAELLGGGDRSRVPSLPARERRHVVRALRGRVLRTEAYALDGDEVEQRPYTVAENRYDIVPVVDTPSGIPDEAWLAGPVVAVVAAASRTTEWERGDDPRTTATFTLDVDRYGNTRSALSVAVPRGRDPRAAAPKAAEPMLATVTTTAFAVRDDDKRYICDRVSVQSRHEVVDDGGRSLRDLAAAVTSSQVPLRLLAHAVTRYDGESFTGLPVGEIGDYGLPKRIASLALTRGILATAGADPAHGRYLHDQSVWPGNGLVGSYFSDGALSVPAFQRGDRALDFTFNGGPDPALCRKAWSARWTAELHAPTSDTYTIAVATNGFARVWVDGVLVVDKWQANGRTSGTAKLDAAKAHALKVEYRATSWRQQVALTWSRAGEPATTVPASALTPVGVPDVSWSGEYPDEFRTGLPSLAGYHYEFGGDGVYEPGYYAVTGSAHDVDGLKGGRGLLTATRDAFGFETTIDYDGLQLLTAAVTDPAGLTTRASYDYRTMKIDKMVDVNGNVTRIGYTPLGLTAWHARLGQPGRDEGDTGAQPGVVFDYGLTAYDESPSDQPQPVWVHTTRRVDFRWALVDRAQDARRAAGQAPLTPAEVAAMFPADEVIAFPERFVQARAYNDGSGRVLQTRRQADRLAVDDLGLTADPSVAAGPLKMGDTHASSVRVVVSAPKTYDNKGNVIAAWEPYYDDGWAYRPASDVAAAADLACTRTFYDARSRVVRVLHPDGSYDLTVYGVPTDPAAPQAYTPTPWERYSYDRNDNAGRSHPEQSHGWRSHWNTPSSVTVDARDRISTATRRNGDKTITLRMRYDADDRVVATFDPTGRAVATTVYDLLGRSWRSTGIDSGAVLTVCDAAGRAVERRDAKGATVLTGYDRLGRATRTWAADRSGSTTTLRVAVVYGDDAEAGLATSDAASANLLGRTYRVYDDAGTVQTPRYDLSGAALAEVRRFLSPATLCAALPGARGPDAAYVVDWTPAAGRSREQHAAALLDPAAYETASTWDALGRRIASTAPLDAEGRRRVTATTYGASGAVTAVTVDGVALVEAIAYDARGQSVAVLHGNGILVRSCYDQDTFRLVREHAQPVTPVPGGWQPHGTVVVDECTTYDLVGNPLTVLDQAPGSGVGGSDTLRRVFAYDPLYRLTKATGREHIDPRREIWSAAPRGSDAAATRAYTELYGYDDLDNMTSITHRAAKAGWTRKFALASGGNRLATVTMGKTTLGYDYDACGNLIAETSSRHFAWNAHDEMTAFWVQPEGAPAASQFAQYRYRTGGDRALKIVRNQDGGLEVTLEVGGGLRRMLLVGTGGTATAYDELTVSAAAGHVVLRIGPALPGEQRPPVGYHVADRLGSSVAVLDATGALVNREEYGPYGETTFGSYARKRYRFTGKERDSESGLGYHGVRYYAPWLARWTSCDPAGLVDGVSPYTFVRANPMVFTDPTGMAAKGPKTSGTVAKKLPPPVEGPAGPPTAEGRLTGAGEPIDLVTGPYNQVHGHHILQSAAHREAASGKDPFHGSARCISQKEGDFTPEMHDIITQTQNAAHDAMLGKFTGVREVKDAAGVTRVRVEVHEGASATDRLNMSKVRRVKGPGGPSKASQYAEETIGYKGAVGAGIPRSQALEETSLAGDERIAWGSTPTRVPNTPRNVKPDVTAPLTGTFAAESEGLLSRLSSATSTLYEAMSTLSMVGFVLEAIDNAKHAEQRGWSMHLGVGVIERDHNIRLPNGYMVLTTDGMWCPVEYGRVNCRT